MMTSINLRVPCLHSTMSLLLLKPVSVHHLLESRSQKLHYSWRILEKNVQGCIIISRSSFSIHRWCRPSKLDYVLTVYRSTPQANDFMILLRNPKCVEIMTIQIRTPHILTVLSSKSFRWALWDLVKKDILLML